MSAVFNSALCLCVLLVQYMASDNSTVVNSALCLCVLLVQYMASDNSKVLIRLQFTYICIVLFVYCVQ